MENKQFNNREEYTIDLLYLAKALVKKAWFLILMGIIVGALAFGYTSNFMTPMYSSSVLLYVNNSSLSLGNVSISASELSAAQSLVDTYHHGGGCRACRCGLLRRRADGNGQRGAGQRYRGLPRDGYHR